MTLKEVKQIVNIIKSLDHETISRFCEIDERIRVYFEREQKIKSKYLSDKESWIKIAQKHGGGIFFGDLVIFPQTESNTPEQLEEIALREFKEIHGYEWKFGNRL